MEEHNEREYILKQKVFDIVEQLKLDSIELFKKTLQKNIENNNNELMICKRKLDDVKNIESSEEDKIELKEKLETLENEKQMYEKFAVLSSQQRAEIMRESFMIDEFNLISNCLPELKDSIRKLLENNKRSVILGKTLNYVELVFILLKDDVVDNKLIKDLLLLEDKPSQVTIDAFAFALINNSKEYLKIYDCFKENIKLNNAAPIQSIRNLWVRINKEKSSSNEKNISSEIKLLLDIIQNEIINYPSSNETVDDIEIQEKLTIKMKISMKKFEKITNIAFPSYSSPFGSLFDSSNDRFNLIVEREENDTRSLNSNLEITFVMNSSDYKDIVKFAKDKETKDKLIKSFIFSCIEEKAKIEILMSMAIKNEITMRDCYERVFMEYRTAGLTNSLKFKEVQVKNKKKI